MPIDSRGFTLIELMIVIAIIGIMATMAMPSYQDRVIQAEVSEGLNLADFARQTIAARYSRDHSFPHDNQAAGLPPADHIVGNYVTALTVRDGAIDITYGGQSNRFLVGKVLSLRPATVPGYPQVPIAWVCGQAPVPGKMQAAGANQTTLPLEQLPLDCRGR